MRDYTVSFPLFYFWYSSDRVWPFFIFAFHNFFSRLLFAINLVRLKFCPHESKLHWPKNHVLEILVLFPLLKKSTSFHRGIDLYCGPKLKCRETCYLRNTSWSSSKLADRLAVRSLLVLESMIFVIQDSSNLYPSRICRVSELRPCAVWVEICSVKSSSFFNKALYN